MNFIEKIGNLKIYCEECGNLLYDDFRFTLYAINGTDIVANETYTGKMNAWTIREAVEKFMYHTFDTCTYKIIRAGISEIATEYDGRLLSGKIAGFNKVEYFKQIDDTRYYKHFTHRPMM